MATFVRTSKGIINLEHVQYMRQDMPRGMFEMEFVNGDKLKWATDAAEPWRLYELIASMVEFDAIEDDELPAPAYSYAPRNWRVVTDAAPAAPAPNGEPHVIGGAE